MSTRDDHPSDAAAEPASHPMLRTAPPEHPGLHTLRRLAVGELDHSLAQAVRTHATQCERCRTQLHGLEEEQRRFEQAVPFEAFAAGVERAQRGAVRERPVRPARSRLGAAIALAATVLAVVGLGPILLAQLPNASDGHRARLKGGTGMELVIQGTGNGPQRLVEGEESAIVAPGERVRIGYQAGALGYVAAVSVDAHGEVSALYPAAGQSTPAERGDQVHYLPDAWEFTGRGLERVVVVLSDQPLPIDALTRAAKEAYAQANGDLAHLPPLALPGASQRQFHRTLLKP